LKIGTECDVQLQLGIESHLKIRDNYHKAKISRRNIMKTLLRKWVLLTLMAALLAACNGNPQVPPAYFNTGGGVHTG